MNIFGRAWPWMAPALAIGLAACAGEPSLPLPAVTSATAVLEIEVVDFIDNRGIIRPRYTCQGLNISPEIAWTESPEGTITQMLLMEDLDAPGGSFTHWLLFDVPVETNRFLAAAGPDLGDLPLGATQGLNSFGSLGYRGPCPRVGSGPHRYVINIYALDTALGLLPRASRNDVLAAIDGHIIAQGTLAGLFER